MASNYQASLALMLAVAVTAGGPMSAQKDWIGWGQDSGGTKFSDLTQINAANVKGLKRAWVFHTGDSTGFFESTPLVIDSVMYFSTTQAIFALDAVSGPADLEVRNDRHRPARTDLLAGRKRPRAANLFVGGRRPGGARRQDRDGGHELRTEGGHSGTPRVVAALHLQERADHAGRQLDRQGVGHRDRRAAMDTAVEGAARRSEHRDVGGR